MSAPSEPAPEEVGAPPAAAGPDPLSLRDRLIGLGEHSHRKSYYPELQRRLDELERFRVLLDQSEDGFLLFALPHGALVDLNGAARRLFALGGDPVPRTALLELVGPAERGAFQAWLEREAPEPLTVEVDGRQLELVHRRATFRDGRFAVLTARDVTARRRMEDALRRKDEELLQAQKLEAIGRLAGGIAHDFNNMLTVIVGMGAGILEELSETHPLRPEMGEILRAAQRATALTRQLLAFGRKQLLQPRAVDVNAVISGIERMMGRIIGEHVTLELDLAPDAQGAFADPGQLEQVLVNLVVNARDAMPGGGRIRLTTRARDAGGPGEERVGSHVEIAISDTGIGMDEATRARIFEPFFTTKGLGRGTGLGLSTVYGIVRQSGGQVLVESEPGRGTTFRVLLPRVSTEAPGPTTTPGPQADAGRGEAVLVVEDDPAVLRFLCEALRAGGYTPLACADAEQALRVARERGGDVHLLLSDVVMPGRSGPDLADALVALHPGLRVLFISGYADDATALQRRLGAGSTLLPKPFSAAELLTAVRRALGARGG